MTPARLLVANIGSTSFKFRLFEMPSERILAVGGVERIGSAESPYRIKIGSDEEKRGTNSFPNYEAAIHFVENALGGFQNLAAVGFKPVMAQGISGTQLLDETVLVAMERLNTLLPAHNPPYVAAVRSFHRALPNVPCIGTFETAFYDEVPEANLRYPVPKEWEEKYGIRRQGFHGASHRYVTERCAELTGRNDLRLISCHLGGSSSIAAVRDGKAIDSSWGMTAQSGLPHNNRAGDFDAFAVIYLARDRGLGLEEVERVLTRESGLKGLSGLPSGDIRDIETAANNGNAQARLALDVFVTAIRKFIGQFLAQLNGADAIIFTAGIGENSALVRERVCAGFDYCGLKLDSSRNREARGGETKISADDSTIEVRIIPTNEELVIARNAWRYLQASRSVS